MIPLGRIKAENKKLADRKSEDLDLHGSIQQNLADLNTKGKHPYET